MIFGIIHRKDRPKLLKMWAHKKLVLKFVWKGCQDRHLTLTVCTAPSSLDVDLNLGRGKGILSSLFFEEPRDIESLPLSAAYEEGQEAKPRVVRTLWCCSSAGQPPGRPGFDFSQFLKRSWTCGYFCSCSYRGAVKKRKKGEKTIVEMGSPEIKRKLIALLVVRLRSERWTPRGESRTLHSPEPRVHQCCDLSSRCPGWVT